MKISTSLAILLACAWSPTAHAEPTPLGVIAGAQSPEDLLQLPGSPWIVVSAMRSKDQAGRLLLVDSRDPTHFEPLYPPTAARPIPGAPDAAIFAPHGIAARLRDGGQLELLVVDHGGGEGIDRFILEDRGRVRPEVTRVSRIASPPGTAANGVAPMPDGGFVMTSMYDPRDPEYVEKFARAEATGGIWRWSRVQGWRPLSKLRFSAANGIAVSRDGKTVFASEWAARKLWRIPVSGAEPSSVSTGFQPDNLRWMDDGQLLVAGQTADSRSLFRCQATPPCPMGYVVASVDPRSLTLTTLLQAGQAAFEASGFGSATGAIRVGDSLWLGTFFADRIARFPLH
jgi:hypothetical protein